MSDPLDGGPTPEDVAQLKEQHAAKVKRANKQGSGSGVTPETTTTTTTLASGTAEEAAAYSEWREAAREMATAMVTFKRAEARFNQALKVLSSIVAPVNL